VGGIVLKPDVEDQPALLDAQHELVGTARRAVRLEAVGFQEIINGDFPLLLDFAGASDDGAFVELDDGGSSAAAPGSAKGKLKPKTK
jgi:hypothetical protein